MIENAKKMGCGGCGNETFAMYKAEEGTLIGECTQCKSTTRIRPSKPTLVFEWGEDSDGIMAVAPSRS